MKKDYYVQLNIQDDFDKHIGVVKLNETDSIQLNINLTENGMPYDLSGADYATMAIIKPDGTFNNGYCEIVDGPAGKLTYVLPVNTVNQTGVFRGEVQAFNNTSMISTAAFSYEVKNSLLRDEGVTTQPEYPILVQLIGDVETALIVEALRVTAENGRVTAESSRVTAESGRATAESARVTSENTRNSQETARVSAESSRVTAETSRASAETTRTTAETTRQSNESTRQTRETARSTTETGRVSAETGRITAENARVSNENARASAETIRVNQESGRVSAESVRVTEFQTILNEWEAIQDADVRAEVIAARNGAASLDARLDAQDVVVASKASGQDILDLIDGAPSNLDTLYKIANAIGNDPELVIHLQEMINSKLPSTSYTAVDVLTKLVTVDGVGSGLDADTIDGKHLASLLASGAGYLAGSVLDLPDNSFQIVGNVVTGLPTADFYVATKKTHNTDTQELIATCMNTPHTIYKKMKVNGVWQTAWAKVFSSLNYGAIITKSASATLALSDADSIVRMTGASAQTITVPTNAAVAFPIGTQIVFIMAGAGAVTFAPSGGVTLESSGAKRTINAQYESVTLVKTGTDTWSLIGALKV